MVGGGGGGLSAALTAREAGASVLIVEKGAKVGGSTALSGGAIMAAGTSVQRAAGIADDTADDFFDYYMAFNQWDVDPSIVRRFCDEGASLIDWLIELGVEFRPEDLYRPGSERVARSHRPFGNGAALIDALHSACRRRDIDIALGTRVSGLLLSGDRVCGISADDQELTAGAVVVTSGGFGQNQDLLAKHLPVLGLGGGPPFASAAPETNVGDGLLFCSAIGAATTGTDHGVIGLGTGIRDIEPLQFGWLLLVDSTGRRYINEMAPYFVVTPRTIAHGGTGWVIFDERARQSGPPAAWRPSLGAPSWMSDAIALAAGSGAIASADDPEELAKRIGVPPEALSSTLDRYNQDCSRGCDSQFLKEPVSLVPFATPPFYAVAIRPNGATVTGFGPQIDSDARVLAATDWQPIPGLYAAGEVTGSVLGPQYLGGGNAVTSAVLFGRVAGGTATGELPR